MLLRFPTLSWGMDLARVPDTWLVALRLTGLGWYVATCIVAGVLGGIWLDKLLGAKIGFFLVGTVLGVIVAFWGLYKLLQPILNASKATAGSKHLEEQGEKH